MKIKIFLLTVSSGWQISSFSVSLIRNTTSGYARRGGAPKTSGGLGDLSTITFSIWGCWFLKWGENTNWRGGRSVTYKGLTLSQLPIVGNVMNQQWNLWSFGLLHLILSKVATMTYAALWWTQPKMLANYI